MKKRLLSIVLVFVLLGSLPVYADTTAASTAPPLRLTLEEAQKMALENSVTYQSQDSYIRNALDAYDDTVDKTNKKSISKNLMTYFSSTINNDISVANAANSVTSARLQKENVRRSSDLNVKNAFLNIKKAQYSLDDAKNNVVLKQKDLDSAKIKCALGYITKDNLKTYEKAYTDAVSDQDTALKNLQQELQTLNKYLGRELTDYNIELVMDLTPVNISDINLDVIREAYIKNSSSIYTVEQKLEIAQRTYELTQERYDNLKQTGTDSFRQDMKDAVTDAERNYNTAKSDYDDVIKKLNIDLDSSYNSLKTSSEAIDKLNRDIADYKKDLAKAAVQYDLGLISKVDYENKEIGLTTMQNKLNSTIADQNMMYANMMLYVDNVETASK